MDNSVYRQQHELQEHAQNGNAAAAAFGLYPPLAAQQAFQLMNFNSAGPAAFALQSGADLKQAAQAEAAAQNQSSTGLNGFMSWLLDKVNPMQGAQAPLTPFMPSAQAGIPAALVSCSPAATDIKPYTRDTGTTSSVSEGSKDSKRPRDDDVTTLVLKVQRRLQQNRESARKCRQRKKAYVQQLEEELVGLRRRQTDNGGREGAAAPQVLTDSAPSSAARDAVIAVREQQTSIASKVQTIWDANITDDEARSVCDALLDLVRKHKKCMDEYIKADLFAVLGGDHMFPEERLLLWMGGTRPSQLLQFISKELHSKNLLAEAQSEQMVRLQEAWHFQEEAHQVGFEQLRTAVITAQCSHIASDKCSATPQMLGKMDAMGLLLSQAEDFRLNSVLELVGLLRPRQLMLALATPLLLLDKIRKLRDAVRA